MIVDVAQATRNLATAWKQENVVAEVIANA